MRHLFTLVLSLALCLGLADPASAQCSAVPGTGCPGQTNPVCGTQPQIGTNFIFRCPPTCFPSTSQIIILGTTLSVPVPLPAPPMCAAGCTLGCSVITTLAAPGATLAIPNNPGLVGFPLCIQCLCQVSGATCFTISQATQALIF
jgi:hypothetical protein